MKIWVEYHWFVSFDKSITKGIKKSFVIKINIKAIFLYENRNKSIGLPFFSKTFL